MPVVNNGRKAKVYCSMCTRAVDGLVMPEMRRGHCQLRVIPGQKCGHCRASMDACFVLALLPQALPLASHERLAALRALPPDRAIASQRQAAWTGTHGPSPLQPA